MVYIIEICMNADKEVSPAMSDVRILRKDLLHSGLNVWQSWPGFELDDEPVVVPKNGGDIVVVAA